ncbi:unnamed protein product, partial [Staurois parvus]
HATGGNLPLGRGLGQQAATYHWAGASGNRRQSTPGQGSRGLNGTLAVESGLSTDPTQLSRDIGFMGTQRVAMAQALRGTTGHAWSVHTVGQLGTRVVGAHSGDSSEHEWSVHTPGTVQNTSGRCTPGTVQNTSGRCTPGTVQNTGGQCTQQAQFRTQVVSAHNRDSSGHGWSVHTVGT